MSNRLAKYQGKQFPWSILSLCSLLSRVVIMVVQCCQAWTKDTKEVKRLPSSFGCPAARAVSLKTELVVPGLSSATQSWRCGTGLKCWVFSISNAQSYSTNLTFHHCLSTGFGNTSSSAFLRLIWDTCIMLFRSSKRKWSGSAMSQHSPF